MSTDDKTGDSFASLFEAETRGQKPQKARRLALGELVRAEIVQIGKDALFVEVAPGRTEAPAGLHQHRGRALGGRHAHAEDRRHARGGRRRNHPYG
jgi:hypothetical protein